MTVSSLRRCAACHWAASAALVLFLQAALAQKILPADVVQDKPAPAVNNSGIDAPLFYQLLIGEIELSAGQAGNAYQIMLDAARRTRDEQLFRRATEIALEARAGEQALAATRAWRSARTRVAGGDPPATADPAVAEPPERPFRADAGADQHHAGGAARGCHRLAAALHAARIGQAPGGGLLEEVLEPYIADATTRAAAQVAIGRGWLAAGDADRALEAGPPGSWRRSRGSGALCCWHWS